ncbi:hypothetical protein FRC14_002584 [Serendipita sp. 396]|nr:hypothetical protein FRC14_002584 [Serendipita sp. 396]KAG8788476.1 hypothetical protein FRC15_004140 [Serendipita sp. 397]
MSDCNDSAITTTPPEIWWSILEHTVGIGYLFADTIDGDVEAASPWDNSLGGHNYFRQFEKAKKQIFILGLVCKSWKQCVDSIASRFLILKAPGNNKNWDMEVITAAQIVYAVSYKPLLPNLLEKLVQWRVLETTLDDAMEMRRIPHPNLRRLDLHDRYQKPVVPLFDANTLIYALSAFSQITWFSYYTLSRYLAISGAEGPAMTFPNLRVLQYHSNGRPCLPYRRLILPSLRHLSIQISELDQGYYPLCKPILIGYGPTLRSISINVHSLGCLMYSDEGASFPDWSQVPQLRYLMFTAAISLIFQPLPRTHPLRVFAAEIWKIDDLHLWLDSDNLREVRMLWAIWEPNGILVRKSRGRPCIDELAIRQGIDQYTMERLRVKAACRGIVLRTD